jgi:glutamine synthetase
MTRGEELVFLAWNDLVGVTRGRGIPLKAYASRKKTGINWCMAGHALTPFDNLAPNPWGSMLEAHMVPVPETEVRVDLGDGQTPLHFVLCDGLTTDGQPWDADTRGFCKAALADLERRAGVRLYASPELEFQLLGDGLAEAAPFSIEAFQVQAALGGRMVAAMRQAGTEPETFEPEFGAGQYEISCKPAVGIGAADRIVIVKEVLRDVARRAGYRASFTPKAYVDRPGNGAHIHFSLQRPDGKPMTHDPRLPAGLSEKAAQFAAGVVRHLPALCALGAASPPSYLRISPHRWSSAYACLGVDNREAALRVCLPPKGTAEQTRRLYNLEYRPADGAANPYLLLGALARAGLDGIENELPLPPLVSGDPHDMDGDKRRALDIVPLPATLGEALDALERDAVVMAWFAPNLIDTFIAVKRTEIAMCKDATPEQICTRYRNAY